MGPKKNPIAARIKKLMQADEEVGKIAQATPVLMAKALEMFMVELMKSTTDIASAHGAKTVSAGHLRASIMGNEKFDFLKDVVEGVPDLPPPEAGAGIAADAAAGGKNGSKRSRSQIAATGSLGVGSLDDDGYDEEQEPKVARAAEAPEPAADPAVESAAGSLGEGAGQAPSLQGTLGSLGGSLAEDDDYDDL